MHREYLAGRNLADNSTASEETLQLSSGPLELKVSTNTGRLLSLTNQAGLLSAKINSEVRCLSLKLICASGQIRIADFHWNRSVKWGQWSHLYCGLRAFHLLGVTSLLGHPVRQAASA